MVEHDLGKIEGVGSNPMIGSINNSIDGGKIVRDNQGEGNFKAICIGICIVVVLILCSCAMFINAVAPNAGQEAVLVHKPIIFGTGGVDPTPIKTGRQYVWFSTHHVMVNMLPQQLDINLDDFMSMDGVPLDFHAVIRLVVTDSVALVSKFGPDWYKNNVQAEFVNRTRQAVRKHGMNEVAIETKAIDAIDAEVSEGMRKYITDANLPIRLIEVTVGKANPPDAIKNQRIATAAEQQRKITEEQRKIAEDARLAAEQSRAAADNAYREAMQLDPNQYLALENIKMMHDVCGKGGCTFLVGGTTVSPVYDTTKKNTK